MQLSASLENTDSASNDEEISHILRNSKLAFFEKARQFP